MTRPLLAANLRMLVSGMEPFCEQAMDAIVDCGPEAVPELCALLMDASGSVRPRVTIALMRIGADAIVSRLPELGSVEKVSALQILADLGRLRATPAVVEELTCEIPEVRAAAAATLGRLQDKRAVSALELAVGDPVAEVRVSAIEALGRLGVARAAPILAVALSDRNVQVRRTAVTILCNLSCPEAGDALCGALRDEDVVVRARAALGLGQLGRSDATSRLVAMARSDHARARDAAIVALGRCGDATAIRPLCEILNQVEETRHSTCNALSALAARHPHPEFRAALPELRRLARTWPSAPVRVRSAAARARDVIESVTARVRHLPTPSKCAAVRAEDLPIPGAGAKGE